MRLQQPLQPCAAHDLGLHIIISVQLNSFHFVSFHSKAKQSGSEQSRRQLAARVIRAPTLALDHSKALRFLGPFQGFKLRNPQTLSRARECGYAPAVAEPGLRVWCAINPKTYTVAGTDLRVRCGPLPPAAPRLSAARPPPGPRRLRHRPLDPPLPAAWHVGAQTPTAASPVNEHRTYINIVRVKLTI